MMLLIIAPHNIYTQLPAPQDVLDHISRVIAWRIRKARFDRCYSFWWSEGEANRRKAVFTFRTKQLVIVSREKWSDSSPYLFLHSAPARDDDSKEFRAPEVIDSPAQRLKVLDAAGSLSCRWAHSSGSA